MFGQNASIDEHTIDEYTIDERALDGCAPTGQRAHSPGCRYALPRAMCSLSFQDAPVTIYGAFIYGVFIYGVFMQDAFCPNMSRSFDVRTIM
ncbi:hypothetical protein [Xylanibacter rodentium]|uniref:Uncharacterized protein n=2 Tax=Xylanibacter rodentium TaxID=2736289 RepID=A0ABX2AZR5_9BACT|nr:hypothetical protein [Xylanibacter rodentium]NPE12115.1 hypothetical protein [Prevotella sp. PJ1A]NPE15185.1 hypothetical protein [Xylanibacter rodentium]NPE39343.1 hypothetical protein [Prevotella sp. PCJ2]